MCHSSNLEGGGGAEGTHPQRDIHTHARQSDFPPRFVESNRSSSIIIANSLKLAPSSEHVCVQLSTGRTVIEMEYPLLGFVVIAAVVFRANSKSTSGHSLCPPLTTCPILESDLGCIDYLFHMSCQNCGAGSGAGVDDELPIQLNCRLSDLLL